MRHTDLVPFVVLTLLAYGLCGATLYLAQRVPEGRITVDSSDDGQIASPIVIPDQVPEPMPIPDSTTASRHHIGLTSAEFHAVR